MSGDSKQANRSGLNGNSLIVDSTVEDGDSSSATVSAQQEDQFFARGGAQFHLLQNQQNLGYLGKFFGANSVAPTNIAGFIIICSIVILAISLFVPSNTDLVEARKWLIGLITSAMSFVFGAASKKE